MSKKKGESAAGLLLNTFGTLFLITAITICVLNFIKDGRAYHMLAEQASARTGSTEVKDKTDSSEKDTAKSTNKKSSETTQKQAPKPVTTKKPTVTSNDKTADGNKDNTGADKKKPVKPGEEP